MKVNVENIKVLNVNNNGEIIVFKNDDIIELEYNSVRIKGRLAKIEDHLLTVDCSEVFFANIHEVAIEEISWISKASEACNRKAISNLELEEKGNEYKKSISTNEILDEALAFDQEISNEREENAENNVSLENAISSKTEENEEDESVSLFGSIKRNYAQGISPILNR